jgi:GNAT superfamily N-acetyltransferase
MAAVPERIRPATPADAGELAALRYEFRAALDPIQEPAETFQQRCASWMATRLATGAWRCWVGEQEGRIIGTVWLFTIEKLPNPVAEPEQHAYVSSLYVRPQYRGSGLGSRLLATVLATCEAERCDAVFLWPTARSRSLYLRHGFEAHQDLLERRRTPAPTHRSQP